ncbi:MAG: hypothetical protein CMQ40_12130 [Gammaproteobacteria bacterium]|nr:hypothetical protein [Gammaproteobacteria bacterium]|tara:strand:- start:73 stop:393 length:321 start_codon:yes stop_codon:yes gene_type:complete
MNVLRINYNLISTGRNSFPMKDVDYRKIGWRARRGMWELDLLLVPYCKEVLMSLPRSAQETFSRLLEEEDADLLSWFSRESSPDDEDFEAMIVAILDWKRKSVHQA